MLLFFVFIYCAEDRALKAFSSVINLDAYMKTTQIVH